MTDQPEHDETAFRRSIAGASVIGLVLEIGLVYAGHRYVLAHPVSPGCPAGCSGDPLADGLGQLPTALGNAAAVSLSYLSGIIGVGVVLGWTQLRQLKRTNGVAVALSVGLVAGFAAAVFLPVAKHSGPLALEIWVAATLLTPPILMGLICSTAKPLPPIDWQTP